MKISVSRKLLMLAAMIGLGIGSVVPSALAYNQNFKGATGCKGSCTVDHTTAGNQSLGQFHEKGNAGIGPNRTD